MVFGIELGQIHRQPEAAAQILAANPYDFVLASLHRVEHTDLSLFNYQAIDGKALRRIYGEELLEIAEKGDYDCLSHLDLIRRYPAFQGVTLRMEEDMEIVEEILRQVIRRGKGIEINTTAGTLTEPLPSLEILKTYRRLGGEIVTTGSDAHRAEDVAKGFANAEALLREAANMRAVMFIWHGPQERKRHLIDERIGCLFLPLKGTWRDIRGRSCCGMAVP